MKEKFLGWILFLITICNGQYVGAQELLTNVYGRQYTFLNGKWNAIIDPYQQGRRTSIYKNRPLRNKADFKEYECLPTGIRSFQNLNIMKVRCGMPVNLR